MPPLPAAQTLLDRLLAPAVAGRRPPPALHRYTGAHAAHCARAKRLAQAVADPPPPGHTLHLLSTGACDLGSWIPLLLRWLAPADHLTIVTFSISAEYLDTLLAAHDSGQVAPGRLRLLAGLHIPRHDPALARRIRADLPARGCPFRFVANHAKLILASAGAVHLTLEASANLNTNRRIESFALTHDRTLHNFHLSWLDPLFALPEPPPPPHAPRAPTVGYSFRFAGLGVLAATRSKDARRAVLAWKRAPAEDPAVTTRFAAQIVTVIRHYLPTLPAAVTVPPQGASAPGHYFAASLVRAVAAQLRLPVLELVARTDTKRFHGPWYTHDQAPYTLLPGAVAPPTALVIDDLITGGHTMRLTLAALAAAGTHAWGFAYNGRDAS